MNLQTLAERLDYPGVLAWYLLGSAARDALRPDSDIDLGALPWPGVNLDRVELVRWSGVLALEWGRDVDIGVVNHENLVYAKEALTTGVLLTTLDPGMTLRHGAHLLALYLHFQEDRQGVLDAYRAG